MNRSRGARWWRALFVVIPVLLIGILIWLWVERDRPPLAGLETARMTLNKARLMSREEEALPLFQAAQDNLDQAQAALDHQFHRIVLFRNYDLVRYQISRGEELCDEGVAANRRARENWMTESAQKVASLRHSLDVTRSLLQRMSLSDGALAKLTSAEARLKVADERLSELKTDEAREMLKDAEQEISEASNQLQACLTVFLTRRAQWNAWIQETVAWSERADSPALLIDKLNHECYVLRRGRVIDSYPVDLGGMWMSQKLREGDQATPEGKYTVAEVKGSRFYRAALLNYPNEEDRARFVRAKRKGQIPGSARIGGLIEIHGEGGRGADWTSGCVSLSNGDLDQLLRHVRPGTQVTIVGLWQEPGWLQKLQSGDDGRSD